MIKHGNIQSNTIRKLNKIETRDDEMVVTDNDIEVLRAYIDSDMDPVAKENDDWCHSYALAIKCMENQKQ